MRDLDVIDSELQLIGTTGVRRTTVGVYR